MPQPGHSMSNMVLKRQGIKKFSISNGVLFIEIKIDKRYFYCLILGSIKLNKMNSFRVGDHVSVLDEDINGTVLSVKNNEITIETEDGFLMTFFVKELIKLHNTNNLLNSIRSVDIDKVQIDQSKPKSSQLAVDRKNRSELSVPEFDLHIEKLVKNYRGMSNFDILTLQSETAKRHIEFAIRNRIPKIVFIHGVGEGILKAELDFLFGRYANITFEDANYQKYGLGATVVCFKQNPK